MYKRQIEGYVPQKKLFNVIPAARYGILIDKNTQIMTIYEDGHKLGQITVSSGLMAQDKLFRETRAGAFLTTDRMINFKSCLLYTSWFHPPSGSW